MGIARSILEKKLLFGSSLLNQGRFIVDNGLSYGLTGINDLEPDNDDSLSSKPNMKFVICVSPQNGSVLALYSAYLNITAAIDNSAFMQLAPTTDSNFQEYSPKRIFIYPINKETYSKETEIINEYKSLISVSEEKALLYLYNELIELHDSPVTCDKFLKNASELDLSVDAIVHILNSLSPIKEQLKNWSYFVSISTFRLTTLAGEKATQSLLKVII